MKIGLLGHGTVGSGIYEIINKRFKDLEIKKVLVKEPKERDLRIFTTNPDDIIFDNEIDLVIDALSDSKTSYELVKKAINSSKNVISCNKDMVCHHLHEISSIAVKNNVTFSFDATVGAGIPWIRTIYDIKKINNIEYIYGNFNGTSNFILDLMRKEGISFEDALNKSRMLRYHEPDYKDDILGIDARNKLALSAMVAFDIYLDPEKIPTFGIENIRSLDFGFFARNNLVVKPMAFARKLKDKISLFVAPTIYNKDEIRANIDSNYNFLGFEGDILGRIEMIGAGSGKFQTANGVISDILSMDEKKSRNYDKKEISVDHSIINNKFYFSFDQSSSKIERILLPYVYSMYETNDSFIFSTRNISLEQCLELVEKINETNEKYFFAVLHNGV